MPIEQLILLALIQGLTEFLPISSSAHLILFPALTGYEDQGALIDVAAHLGSLGAVLLYFRRDTAALARGGVDTLRFRATQDRKLFLMIAAATIPTLLAAGALVALDATEAMRETYVIALSTIVFGLTLYAADKFGPRRRGVEDMTWRSTLWIGLAQVLAVLFPGTSRSGITITAARALGFTRPEAARYSMLMAIPTILAFGMFSFLQLFSEGSTGQTSDALIVAGLSFVSAYGAIYVFMKLLERISLTPFVIYRLVLGFGLLAYLYF